MDVKGVFVTLGLLCLLFFGIPIRIKKEQLTEDETAFQSYIKSFNKSYGPSHPEYPKRFANYKESLSIIETLNKNRTKGSAFYGLTKFSDLSRNEFRDLHLQNNTSHHNHNHASSKLIKSLKVNDSPEVNRVKRAITDLPMKVDWREKGVINTIRNQNTCGACWAFSTVSTVEAMNALKTGQLLTLSVQELIDCAKNGNYGCEGGDSCTLLEWLTASKTKIEIEKQYPYIHVTQTCKLKGSEDGIQVKSFSCDNFVGSEDGILSKLATHGPVAVAVNAINWQYYLGGTIQYHCSGSPAMLNHAVQIVGYDRTATVPHYIARNSWGPEFGDKGYLYLSIGTNICGLANEVSSLDVA